MNLRYLLLALTLPLLMTSCGLVAAVVPPITLEDPFGVEGESITTEFGATTSAMSTLAESTAEATAGRSFDDQELDLRGFSLARLNAAIGLDGKVVLTAPSLEASFPDTFTLTHVSATAKVSDAVNGSAEMNIENDINLPFTKDAGCVALSCDYSFSGDLEDIKNAIQISEGDRSKLASFVKIIRKDGANSKNEGSFTLSVTADSDPVLDGFKATFKLRSGDASIKLGG